MNVQVSKPKKPERVKTTKYIKSYISQNIVSFTFNSGMNITLVIASVYGTNNRIQRLIAVPLAGWVDWNISNKYHMNNKQVTAHLK